MRRSLFATLGRAIMDTQEIEYWDPNPRRRALAALQVRLLKLAFAVVPR